MKKQDRKYVEHMMSLYGISKTELAWWRGISLEKMEDDLEYADKDPVWAGELAGMVYNYSCECTNHSRI